MRHRLQWFIRLRSHDLRKQDEHPAYTHHGVWSTLYLYLYLFTLWGRAFSSRAMDEAWVSDIYCMAAVEFREHRTLLVSHFIAEKDSTGDAAAAASGGGS